MKGNYKHGMRHSRIYNIWRTMRQRCNDPKCINFRNYGGKGVSVCGEWQNSFVAFYEWAIENGYSEDLTIDRIDVNGDYEPSNCRWVSQKVQQNNRSNNRKICVDGICHTLAEWSDITGIKIATIHYRLKRGWTPEEAISKNIIKGVSKHDGNL